MPVEKKVKESKTVKASKLDRPSKKQDSLSLATYLGFTIKDMKNTAWYKDRKTSIWGVYDNRTQKLAASYSTWNSVLSFLQKVKQ